MNTSFLAGLISALQAGELTLPALLFDELGRRGALSPDQHREELAWLERGCAAGELAPGIASAIAEQLKRLQGDATQTAPADDCTVVSPVGTGTGAGGQDATRLQPAAGIRRNAPTEDATVVAPAGRPGPASDAALPPVVTQTGTFSQTGVSSQTQATGAGTISQTGTRGATGIGAQTGTADASGVVSTSSWQRVAEAQGGEHATVGGLLKGRFHLEREIGRGGMGVVFLARDERKVEARDRNPYVAVKVLNDEFRRHPDSLIALQRESRRSQSLAHDNIVRVYDFDKDGTIVFMTMEYIDGADLKAVIRERAFNGMPLAQAWPLIEGMARALQRAHAAGVVHSDFKPGNVMVTRTGVPKVFDFGIARAGNQLGEAVGEQTVFDAGTLGALTPAYASLEMIQGKEPTPSDDIYALGCVVFELLTGKHPFDKASAEVAMKEGRKPPPVPGLTRRQYATLCSAVAFTGARRLKSADQLLEGLREVRLRERAGPLLLAGMALTAVLAGGGWGVYHYRHVQQIDALVRGFTLDDPQHYANEAVALDALASLDESERAQVVREHGELIQRYLLSRVDAYWNPAQGRLDYAGAQRVFDARDRLQLYLPQLDSRRSAIERERHDRLAARAVEQRPAAAPAPASRPPPPPPQPLPAPASAPTAAVATAAAAAPCAAGGCRPSPAPAAPPPVVVAATKPAPPAPPPHASAVAAASPATRMQSVALKLVIEGERNVAQQNYSAAIANAKAALAVSPGDTRARRLLDRAEHAQQQAMQSISIR